MRALHAAFRAMEVGGVGGVGKVTKDATAKVLRDTKVVKIACVQEDMGNLWKCHDSDYCGNLVSSPMELEQNDWKR